MSISKEKQEKIEKLLQESKKKFGEGCIQFGQFKSEPFPTVCSFGSLNVDLASGIMGVPEGRIGEIFGPESSGKTTLALHIIAECQKNGKVASFVDAEHALDRIWASKLKVDMNQVIFSQPDYGEEALEIVDSLVDSGAVDIIIVDSIPALVPKAELEGEMTDQQMGAQARMMGKAMRKLTAKISKSKCCVIFINQIRMKIGVMFGSPETTPGGNATKFAASFRLDVRGHDVEKEDGHGQLSKGMKIKFVKNKLGSPFKEAEVVLNTNDKDKIYGFDKYSELIDLCVQKEHIKKSGTWYSYNEERLGQGKDNVIKYFKEHKDVFDSLYTKVVEQYLAENNDSIGSFESELDKAIEENAEGKTRKRRTKETVSDSPIGVDEQKVSEGEVVAEK